MKNWVQKKIFFFMKLSFNVIQSQQFNLNFKKGKKCLG